MITISLNQIRAHGPCAPGWERLLKSLGKTKADDEQFPFRTIIESNGLDDAIWALRCLKNQTPTRLFIVACAQEALHLMKDKRSIEAVKLAHLFAYGEIDKKNLDAAEDAAENATEDATWAARAAWAVAGGTVRAVAKDDAVGAAAETAARTARATVRAVAKDATRDARKRQCEWLIAIADNYEA